MTEIDYAELPALAGRDLGRTDWIMVDQERIDRFALATDDFQWIHVDAERAEARGGTIAHGFLTLALLSPLMYRLLNVTGTSHMLNMGTNKTRFTAPVPSGSRVRLHLCVKDVTPRAGGYQVIQEGAFEIEGGERPVCVVESVMLYLP